MGIMDWLNGGLSGLLINNAPKLIKGFMKQYLCQIPFDTMVDWVNTSRSLWNEIPNEYKQNLIDFGPNLGSLDWFTVEWVIQAAAETAPGLASLFLSWPEGQSWLECQIEDIKTHISSGTA
jgi:hypothetical protein